MTRFRLVAFGVTVGFLLLAYGLLRSPKPTAIRSLPLADMPVTPSAGTKWVQAITFSELNTVAAFTAKVEFKETVQGHAGEARNTNRVEFLKVGLNLGGGQALVISQESPDQNAKAFSEYLKIGGQYEFPKVWKDWNTRHNKANGP